MKKILLLGGFGFIGTNILKYIDSRARSEFSVVVFDRFPKHLDNLSFNCVKKVYSGDFSDDYLLGKVFLENHFDIVIHSLSASVPSTSQDNMFDIRYNVLPTIGVLDQMVKHNVNHIVFISSGGAIYGDHYVYKSGHIEEEVLFPKSAYGVSKLIIEKYLYLYSVQHNVNSLVLRLSNPYGPYHYSQKQGIINIAIEKALSETPFVIWGDGNGKKDYIYIEDFCDILLKLIDNIDFSYSVLNVGSGQLWSVNMIADCIKREVRDTFNWSYQMANALDVQDFKLNLSNLMKRIGEYSFTSLEDGVNKTKEWYINKNK